MKRRSFLKTATALFPAAAFQALAHGQTSNPAPAAGAPVVGNGMDRFGDRHPIGYSTVLFKVANRDSGGDLFLIEHRNLGKGGPPLHLHLHQSEWFYVMEGEVLFQLGDSRQVLRPGESVLGPPRVPHAFAGTGATPARMLIAFTPAGMMEAFFRTVAVPNGPPMDAALFARHEMQYLGPPLKLD